MKNKNKKALFVWFVDGTPLLQLLQKHWLLPHNFKCKTRLNAKYVSSFSKL